jgi:LmbE family N-acetylglucosaminyl deacetylase
MPKAHPDPEDLRPRPCIRVYGYRGSHGRSVLLSASGKEEPSGERVRVEELEEKSTRI